MQYSGAENLDVMELAENYNRFLEDAVIREMGESRNIVDFGAGSAYLLRRIAARSGRNIMAVEPADNWEKIYRENHIPRYFSLEEFADESLDFIYSLSVLEHIRDDRTVVKIMHQKLREGGKVFIYVPALPFLYSAMDKKVGHYRRYTKAALAELFDGEWQIKYLRYADILGAAASVGLKWFGAKDGNLNGTAVKIFDRVIYPFSLALDKISAGRIIGKNLILCAVKKSFSAERKVLVNKVGENRHKYNVNQLGSCGVNFEKNIGKIQP